MRLLLIEPDKVLSASLGQAFTDTGFDVIYANSAQTAVSALDTNPADLVVLEPQLGLHNGVEFLYELRSYADWQDLPVVVHSANRSVLDQQFQDAWRQLGVNAVLYKPTTTTLQLIKSAQLASQSLAR